MTLFSRCSYVVFFLLLLTGCDTGGSSEVTLGSMEATIDGSPWTSSLAAAVEFNTGSPYRLSISGTRFGPGTSTSSLSLSLRADTMSTVVPGSYRIGGPPRTDISVEGTYIGKEDIFITDSDSTAGTLTIEAITNLSVRGTFSFTVPGPSGSNSIEITDGAFYVSYAPIPDV